MNDPIPEPLRGADVISWAVPVTRALNAIGDKVGATARNERDRRGTSVLPWTFSCAIGEGEVEGEEERTGGWTNCRLQIGMDIDWHSPDVGNSNVHVIGGTDLCDDGVHYLEVVLANGTEGRENDTAEIKVASPGQVPASNYIDGRIRIQLGVVQDGVIGHTPHFNPVIYKYV